jgi:hypothetical protein
MPQAIPIPRCLRPPLITLENGIILPPAIISFSNSLIDNATLLDIKILNSGAFNKARTGEILDSQSIHR